MYSHEYFYIRLLCDAHAEAVPRTQAVRKINKAMQTWSESFSDPPWLELEPVFADNSGSYRSDSHAEFMNQIVVVASKREGLDKYLLLLKELSELFSWPVILEEDEEGNENVVLYRPSNKTPANCSARSAG